MKKPRKSASGDRMSTRVPSAPTSRACSSLEPTSLSRAICSVICAQSESSLTDVCTSRTANEQEISHKGIDNYSIALIMGLLTTRSAIESIDRPFSKRNSSAANAVHMLLICQKSHNGSWDTKLIMLWTNSIDAAVMFEDDFRGTLL